MPAKSLILAVSGLVLVAAAAWYLYLAPKDGLPYAGLSESEMAIRAVEEFVKSGGTEVRRECLFADLMSSTTDTVEFAIREVHNEVCGGDPATAPRVGTVNVFRWTGTAVAEESTTPPLQADTPVADLLVGSWTRPLNSDCVSEDEEDPCVKGDAVVTFGDAPSGYRYDSWIHDHPDAMDCTWAYDVVVSIDCPGEVLDSSFRVVSVTSERLTITYGDVGTDGVVTYQRLPEP
jgi:hypothetical protein